MLSPFGIRTSAFMAWSFSAVERVLHPLPSTERGTRPANGEFRSTEYQWLRAPLVR